jgi:hypothetical protein
VDQVEVWEDLADEEEHLSHVGSNNERPFRTHKRYLSKGTSVFVPALSQPLVSDDQSLSGEPIKRVRVSKDEIGSMYGLATGFPGRAEFVDLDKVEITCVPQEWTQSLALALPEIPWEEERLPFRL